jgi:hypothetical protein
VLDTLLLFNRYATFKELSSLASGFRSSSFSGEAFIG